jgi:trans-aconitate methyltransferase
VVPGKSHINLGLHAERLAQSEKWAPYFPHFKKTKIYFSKEEYADLLRKYQFEVRAMEAKEIVTIFSNYTALVEWLTPLVNFIDHLPFELQKAFIEDLAQQLLSNMTILPDGSISAQGIKLEIIAVKL